MEQLSIFENSAVPETKKLTNISFLNLKVVKEKSGRYEVQRKITKPSDCYEVAEKVIEIIDAAEESMWLITLDTKGNITGVFEVSRGTLNSSLVHPREIYKRAIMHNAYSIIIMHNHPSGDPTPSQEDLNITTKIAEAGKILNIELLDHVIIGESNYTSMKEKNLF